MNYYEILGIAKDATQRELKAAYRKKAVSIHPDTLSINTSVAERKRAEENFKDLNRIYEILSDPLQRRNYNDTLTQAEKEILIKKIQELKRKKHYPEAIAQAQALHGRFPDSPKCADLYGELILAHCQQLLEHPNSPRLPEVKRYLELALAVVWSPNLKKQLNRIREKITKTDKSKAKAQKSSPKPPPSDQPFIDTKRAVQMLRAGEAGIKAWNQFRGCETYVPNLSGVDLSGTDLSQTNLSDINLEGANLSQANLGETNLSNAQLMQANLAGINGELANFSHANLAGANLTDSCLVNANFSHANLADAQLEQANAHRGNFQGASLENVHWCGGNLAESLCQQANFSGAVLTNTIGKKGDFTKAVLTNVRWEKASLIDASFAQGNLERMDLSQANLCNCNFSEARLSGTNLNGCTSQANKKYPYHSGSIDFSGADLSCATCSETVFTRSNLTNARLHHTNFDQADLSGSSLNNALILNTSFRGCNLRETDLSGTTFYLAYLDAQTAISGAKGI